MAVLILVGWLSIPFFWFVPPWIGTGQPFLAATTPRSTTAISGRSIRSSRCSAAAADLQVVPLARRSRWSRSRLPGVRAATGWSLGLGAAALAWWVLVVGDDVDGYPGLERFFLPAAGDHLRARRGRLVRVARRSRGRAWAARERSASWLSATLAVAADRALGPVHDQPDHAARARRSRPLRSAVTRLDQLSAAVAAVGGHDGGVPVPLELRRRQPLGPDGAGVEAARDARAGSGPRCAIRA